MSQKGFIFDLNKCTGCQACQLACAMENQWPTSLSWRQVYTFNPYRVPALPVFHLSLACNHCVDPPCLKNCPTRAYAKDDQTGAVTIDPHRCIGCHYCSWVCPFDVPRFNDLAGVMEKCTFCAHRLSQALEPACVSLCPTTALQFGDYSAPAETAEISGFPRTEVRPAIRFISKHKNSPPTAAGLPKSWEVAQFYEQIPSFRHKKIELRSEWPLVFFTLCVAFLVGLVAGVRPLPSLWFFGGAGLALGISTHHLSKKWRAYRALANWPQSWLSRELIFFGIFIGLVLADLLLQPNSDIFFGLIVLVGLITLVAIDQVYRMLHDSKFHSAQVLWTGLLFWGLWAANPILFVGVILVKFFLYGYRKFKILRIRSLRFGLRTGCRIGFGFLLPLVFCFTLSPVILPILLASLLVGEVIDRFEFYDEVKISGPANQMTVDFKNQLKKLTNIV